MVEKRSETSFRRALKSSLWDQYLPSGQKSGFFASFVKFLEHFATNPFYLPRKKVAAWKTQSVSATRSESNWRHLSIFKPLFTKLLKIIIFCYLFKDFQVVCPTYSLQRRVLKIKEDLLTKERSWRKSVILKPIKRAKIRLLQNSYETFPIFRPKCLRDLWQVSKRYSL